jgi:hypothetical protein
VNKVNFGLIRPILVVGKFEMAFIFCHKFLHKFARARKGKKRKEKKNIVLWGEVTRKERNGGRKMDIHID